MDRLSVSSGPSLIFSMERSANRLGSVASSLDDGLSSCSSYAIPLNAGTELEVPRIPPDVSSL